MKHRTRVTLGLAVAVMLSLSSLAAAVEPKVELLWPDGAPGARGTADGDKPSLTIYPAPPEKATGAAVVICPGGGYGHLAVDHEGHQIAQWLNSFGVAGFIVQYRHSASGAGYHHPAPLQDAQRAIRIVRSRAKEWGVDPGRIGIIGFSAGGHLASSAATHFNESFYPAKDKIDATSCRPDFAILVYPVISFTEPFTHTGSRKNLLGANASKDLIEKMSSEKQVTPQTPPTFLIHTWEDKVVPAENSIAFYLALRQAKVPAEMHIFLKGPHGFGLGQKLEGTSAWPGLCQKWMEESGFLKSRAQ
jgi:acetyl esterase/lipase